MAMRTAAAVWIACVLVCPAVRATFVEDFDDLDGWTADGDVSPIGGTVLMGDAVPSESYLYRAVAVGMGAFTIEFDFLNGLNAPADASAFPDTFFASLYFVDDPASFDLLGGIFADAQPLFDLDPSGYFNVSGIVSPSSAGGEWQHFTLSFVSHHQYVVPTFELFNLDIAESSGSVALDNLRIGSIQPSPVVPEPTTLMLLPSGIAILTAMSRLRCKVGDRANS